MISLKQAQELVWQNARQLQTEIIRVEESSGRTLAENIKAPFDMPPFDRSAMDGYAVKAKDTVSASRQTPVVLTVAGEIQAGRQRRFRLVPGQAISIMTGAVLPAGADSVVMLEDTEGVETKGKKAIRIFRPVKSGENISFQGEDLCKGQAVLKKGQVIDSGVMAMLAYVGKARVKVSAKPGVAILATGDELRKPGTRVGPNCIYDSNSYGLFGQVLKAGGRPHLLGIARDNFSDLADKMKEGLGYDILLISGGVSEGRYDLVVEVLKSLKVKPVFWKVAIKPGKPAFFGRRGKSLVFGLPGYPVSSYLNFEVLVRWAISRCLGRPKPERRKVAGRFMEDVKNTGDRDALLRVTVTCKNSENFVFPYGRQKSGILSSILRANGLFCLKKGTRVQKGERVVVELLDK